MSRAALVPILLILAAAIAGCGILPGAAPNLEGTAWRAVSVAGRPPVPGSEPTARFEDGRIAGSTGCNRYAGRAVVPEGKLLVTEVTITLADCAEPARSMQKLFMAAMSGSGATRFESGNLVVAAPSGDVVFRRDDSVR